MIKSFLLFLLFLTHLSLSLSSNAYDDSMFNFITDHMDVSDRYLLENSDLIVDRLSNWTMKGIILSNIRISKVTNQLNMNLNTSRSMFLNEVLPYKTLTEPVEPTKQLFFSILSNCCLKTLASNKSNMFQECLENIALTAESMKTYIGLNKSATPEQLADCLPCSNQKECTLWANDIVWRLTKPKISFLAAPPNEVNEYSVFDVLQAKYSSCTGLAITLVSFLRTLGIPSRVAGVLHWHRTKESCPLGLKDPNCANHNWVEVYLQGKWHYVDQDGQVNAIDKAWFAPQLSKRQITGSPNFAIYATSFASPTWIIASSDFTEFKGCKAAKLGYFPLAWNQSIQTVHAWDVTDSYHVAEINYMLRGIET